MIQELMEMLSSRNAMKNYYIDLFLGERLRKLNLKQCYKCVNSDFIVRNIARRCKVTDILCFVLMG